MAKKTETIVTLTDDLDGSKAERTVSFSVDGSNYELELSKKNITAFEKAVQPYITAARKVRSAPSRSRGGAAAGRSRSHLPEIRAWAKENGIDVSERGRIAQSVQEAYDATR